MSCVACDAMRCDATSNSATGCVASRCGATIRDGMRCDAVRVFFFPFSASVSSFAVCMLLAGSLLVSTLIRASKWTQNGTQNGPKMDPEWDPEWDS